MDLGIDLDSGLRAAAGEVDIEIPGPIDRLLICREPYPLGDLLPTASWVRIPCAHATIAVDGEPLPGAPNRASDAHGPTSTAQINVAEVWTT